MRLITNGGLMYILVVVMLLTGCEWAAPDAGSESVLIQKPWVFGHGGVVSEPVKTGRTLVALTTDVIDVDMRPVQYAIHFDDFMSSDGVPLDFDAIIRLRVTNSVDLISRFGRRWYETNVETEFANRVRQAVRKHGLNETAISTDAIDAIDAEVSSAMTRYFSEAGLPVELVQMTVGKANPPDAIKDQRIATAAQQQRQMTERQRKLAEDERKAAEQSRALADNAYRNAMSLSPQQFIALESIKMQREVCATERCTFINGASIPVSQMVK